MMAEVYLTGAYPSPFSVHVLYQPNTDSQVARPWKRSSDVWIWFTCVRSLWIWISLVNAALRWSGKWWHWMLAIWERGSKLPRQSGERWWSTRVAQYSFVCYCIGFTSWVSRIPSSNHESVRFRCIRHQRSTTSRKAYGGVGACTACNIF